MSKTKEIKSFIDNLSDEEKLEALRSILDGFPDLNVATRNVVSKYESYYSLILYSGKNRKPFFEYVIQEW